MNNVESSIAIKVLGSLAIILLAVFISLNNRQRLKSGTKFIKFLATTGLCCNAIWLVLWLLALWGVYDFLNTTQSTNCTLSIATTNFIDMQPMTCNIISVSIWGVIAIFASLVALFCFLASNILSIKEYHLRKIMLPLKITAFVCLIYELILGCIAVILYSQDIYSYGLNFTFESMIGHFAAIIIVLIIVVLLIVSKITKNKSSKISRC